MEPEQPDALALDIENYASNYTGHAKINRLIFISEKTADAQLALQALRIAADELKKGYNTVKYNDVIGKINGRLGPEYQYDRDWADSVDARAQTTQYRLETELSGYKTNLIKESIRMGHHELADFFYDRGDLQSAFKSYVRTRDYCTTPKHITDMCLAVIKCAIELGNYNHVNTYVAKGEQSQNAKDPIVAARLKCAAGLAALDAKKYKVAAKKFSEVSPELGNQYADVIAAGDVALYGGLTALASFDRAELKRSIVENTTFRELLELNPDVREVVYDFFASRYASCLARLQRLFPLLRLDMHLAPHLDALHAAVRSKALIQYTAPFISVNLPTMATAFGTDVGSLERELAELVASGQVQARIDSAAKVLIARLADMRTATFQRALSVGEGYIRDTRALLLRASLLQHDLVQRAPPSQAPRQPRQSPMMDRHIAHMQDRAMMA